MPVFDFKNRWYDPQFQYTSTGSTGGPGNSSDAGAPGPQPAVLSGYFWCYLAASVVLTVITVACWYWYTQILNPVENMNGGSTNTEKGVPKAVGLKAGAGEGAVGKPSGISGASSNTSSGNNHGSRKRSWNPLPWCWVRVKERDSLV